MEEEKARESKEETRPFSVRGKKKVEKEESRETEGEEEGEEEEEEEEEKEDRDNKTFPSVVNTYKWYQSRNRILHELTRPPKQSFLSAVEKKEYQVHIQSDGDG